MFRKVVITVITAWAAILETAADAIAVTLPLSRRRLRAAGLIWHRLSASLGLVTRL